MKRLLLVLLAAALLPAATASAAPEDPPVESVLPADGAVLPVDADGIEVRYTCPEPYRSAGESPFITYGDRKDYGVDFATRPELGSDGRLLQSNVVALSGPDQVQDNDIPAGQCRGYMADPDAKPQAEPGTYYWQAWRSCLSCPGGNETSAVRSFRLTAAGSGALLAIVPPARSYRGFAFVATVTTKGIDTGAGVAVQLKRGASWKTISHTDANGRSSEVAIKLPRSVRPGKYGMRVRAKVGDETLTSRVRRLRVRRAAGWKTSKRQDGRWKGKASGLPVAFRVSAGGRTIRAGTFQLALLCPQAGTNPFTTQIADAPLPRAKIAPDGSFVFAGVVSKHASFVHGRIAGRRAKGKAALSLGVCAGSARFSAKRS